ncbi:hypothetical protein IWQ61_007949 [Dispira simplex]|nr:hypothetical protein IWQ61_007949 [Dispira simplex]
MAEERRSSQNPPRRMIQEHATIDTPGGINQRNAFYEEPLPFDEEEVQAFKLRAELKQIFAKDEPWSAIRAYLLEYGEIEEKNERRCQLKKLRSLAKKKVSEYTLSIFLLYYKIYADRCNYVTDAQKCKILLKVIPKPIKKAITVSLAEEDYTLRVVLPRLQRYAQKQAFEKEFFEDSSSNSGSSSESESSGSDIQKDHGRVRGHQKKREIARAAATDGSQDSTPENTPVELPRKQDYQGEPASDLQPVPQDPGKKSRGKYKLTADIHRLDTDEVVMRHLHSNLGISPYEYIAVAPRAQEILRKSIRRKRVYDVDTSKVVVEVESDSSTSSSEEESDGDSSILGKLFQPMSNHVGGIRF